MNKNLRASVWALACFAAQISMHWTQTRKSQYFSSCYIHVQVRKALPQQKQS